MTNWIYVADNSRDSIVIFAKDASGDVPPTRSIKGPQTNLDEPFAIAVDDNWIYVANWQNKSVAVFPIGATGDVPPTQLIQGSNTTFNRPQGIAVDANWIYVADYSNFIAVFPIMAQAILRPPARFRGEELRSAILGVSRWITTGSMSRTMAVRTFRCFR